jgi:hypothetical protein
MYTMNLNIILKTAYLSLIVQVITAFVGFYGFSLTLPSEHYVLKELLIMETVVQVIELVYYVWLIYNFTSINYDVTHTRYFDWILSTPIMIVSTVLYMKYRNTEEKESLRLFPLVLEFAQPILNILIFNWSMLIFGFLGERNLLSRKNAFIGGTLAFIVSFLSIYTNFVGDDFVNKALFWFMFVFWGLYGVAFCFSYSIKNSMYNILDMFSKNFYGLFLFNEVRKLAM